MKFLSDSLLIFQILPLLMETLRALPLIVFPILYFVDEDEKWMTIGVFVYLGILFTLSFIAMIPTGKEKPGPLEKLTRYSVQCHISVLNGLVFFIYCLTMASRHLNKLIYLFIYKLLQEA